MKKIFVLTLALGLAIGSFAQTVNYALNYTDGAGKVQVFTINELNESPQATFQMWMKPSAWISGAKLLSQDNFSIELGADNVILIKSGTGSATFPFDGSIGDWAQLTMTLTDGSVKAYINNVEKVVTGNLPSIIPASTEELASTSCVIGQGFKGQLDEIRIWKKALEQKDFFWRNTLNKYNPNYDALIAYWKCDQNQCANLVDYKFAHHGVMTNVSRIAVTDNSNFRYRIVTGYIGDLVRFIDRPNINRDMFLMTNDVITLSARVQQDGSIFPQYPDNTATPTSVEYLEEFEGRKGIMDFKGTGSQMMAEDGRIPFDNQARWYAPTNSASFGTWVYIDSWKEGSLLFSKFQDADNCLVIKLGKEDTKDIVVDFCGTVGTLSNKIEIGKWHYIGVYFNPKKADITNNRLSFSILGIGVDYKKYNSLNGLVLSGKNMTATNVPLLATTPIVIGKDFDGKMDEIMVWGGADRSGSAQNDAENGYQWNVGNWNNIFLNAYWKGDDPENIGKDYQSYTGMIDFMRSYYKGYSGAKIRMGIVYPDGDNWRNVLNKPENVDRLIADAKVMFANSDGLDIDLEWQYYNVFNPVVRRIIDEVVKGNKDGKIFTISQHQYSYQLDKSFLNDENVDYFTMQLYGPQPFSYEYDWYVNAHKSFLTYGYPNEKLVLSYGVLLVNNGEEGYKDLFEKYGMNDDNYDPDLNTWNCAGTTKYFNGVTQTKRKQDYIINNNCLGTMYFDMANDQKVSDYKSLIRAQNEILASNVDTLIMQVDMDPTNIQQTIKESSAKLFTFYPNPAQDKIVINLKSGDFVDNAVCEVMTLDGKLVMQTKLYSMNNTLSLTGLNRGIYLLRVQTEDSSHTTKLHIN